MGTGVFMQSASSGLTVYTGSQVAAPDPKTRKCVSLLVDNLYPMLHAANWFTKEWRLKFCAYFLQNLIDQAVEAEVDPRLVERVKHMPLTRGIKLIGKTSRETGLKVLVSLICIELRTNQKMDMEAHYLFYHILMAKLFPDCEIGRK
jgi:hypothetical protein